MKILHIISGADPKHGGPIQGIRNYEQALHQLGIERDLVCFETQEDIIRWQFPSTLNVIGLGKSIGGLQYNNTLVPWLKENIFRYNKVILNGMWTYHDYATFKVINDLRKKKGHLKIPAVYLMPHGMLDPWFQQSNTRRLKAIRNYIYWELVEKRVVNGVDGLLFTCQEELLLARQTFSGYHPKKEYNIGYGIAAPPTFDEKAVNGFCERFDIPTRQPYLLFLSRVNEKKGTDILLEAYLDLLTAGQQLPVMVIAGPGLETPFGQRLLKFTEEYPLLKDRVKFVGHVSGDMKWGAIYGCAAFVLPSHQENFGIAVAEALACARPVLITNKVNIYREIVTGGGGLVNEDTLEGTIKNLTKWFTLTPVEKETMGENARLVYKQHFTIETAAEKYVEVMRNIQ